MRKILKRHWRKFALAAVVLPVAADESAPLWRHGELALASR